ncbi:hypothetical protein [Runella zeae]|uniref:hypothetical protein n=1 Tax=Runella zeae TaxID=94255 RepID=UPI0023545ED9|nr:hypothetical protein [Runella zeae]
MNSDFERILTDKFESGHLHIGWKDFSKPLTNYQLYDLVEVHHDFAWYYYLLKKDIAQAKQHFYLSGRINEILNQQTKDSTDADTLSYRCVTDNFRLFVDVLCSDNESLILRTSQLSYAEREIHIFKEKNEITIATDLCFCIIRKDWERFEKVLPLLKRCKHFPHFSIYDKAFFEGFRKGDISKMTDAIEAIASEEIQRKLCYVEEIDGVNGPFWDPWENVLLSPYGLLYTKIAWMHGFELDIKSPLVSIANELFPVKPLDTYDEVYDFLKEDKAKRNLI